MKTIFAVLAFLLFLPCTAAPFTYEKAALTGDDLAEILELRVMNYKVSFGGTKKICIEATSSGGNVQKFEVKEMTSTVKVRLYIPAATKDAPTVMAPFNITTDTGGGLGSYIGVDTAKLKSWTAHTVKDGFVVTGFEGAPPDGKVDEDKLTPVFKLRVIVLD